MLRYFSISSAISIIFLSTFAFARVNPEATILPNRDGECPEGSFLDCSGNCQDERILEEGFHLDDTCDYGGTTNINFYCEEFDFDDGACGDFDGTATLDDCGIYSGGESGYGPNSNKDCNGDCFGDASLDACDDCSGGNTGFEYNYADQGCGCDLPGPSGCDNECGSTLEFDECGICDGDGIAQGECDCDGNIDLGCGCGENGPSGCDNECGSTAVDAGCGCGIDGPSGCDQLCGSTATVDSFG